MKIALNRLPVVVLSCAFFMGFAPVGHAQDAGLYDPVAPEGSAFVRFVNAGTSAKSYKPTIGGKAYAAVSHNDVGAYVPVKNGDTKLELNKATIQQKLDQKMFYTAILKGDVLTVMQDTPIANTLKSMVAFYNLTDKPAISLKTADAKLEVIKPVASGASGYREINGIQVTFGVFDGDKKIAELPSTLLKRGEATTVIATGTGDAVTAKIAPSKIDTTQ